MIPCMKYGYIYEQVCISKTKIDSLNFTFFIQEGPLFYSIHYFSLFLAYREKKVIQAIASGVTIVFFHN